MAKSSSFNDTIEFGGVAWTAPLFERDIDRLEKELHNFGRENCVEDITGGSWYNVNIYYEEIGEVYVGTSEDAEVQTIWRAKVDFRFFIDDREDWREIKSELIGIFDSYGVDFKDQNSWLSIG